MHKFITQYLSSLLMIFTCSISAAETSISEPPMDVIEIAAKFSNVMNVDVGQIVFYGEVFSQPTTVWQIESEQGFNALLQSLSKQNMMSQNHSVGNLLMLSGEYAQHHLLLQLERLENNAYHGFLSVMNGQEITDQIDDPVQFYRYLLEKEKLNEDNHAPWLPDSALLLMNIKSPSAPTQSIYFLPINHETLQEDIRANMTALGWYEKVKNELGFSTWHKDDQRIQFYYSQQAEGTALYVLDHNLIKDVYENTHE